MNNLPRTQEEQMVNMAKSGRVSRNWLEMVAYNTGVDFDHIRQIDEDFCDRYHKNEKENEENQET